MTGIDGGDDIGQGGVSLCRLGKIHHRDDAAELAELAGRVFVHPGAVIAGHAVLQEILELRRLDGE